MPRAMSTTKTEETNSFASHLSSLESEPGLNFGEGDTDRSLSLKTAVNDNFVTYVDVSLSDDDKESVVTFEDLDDDLHDNWVTLSYEPTTIQDLPNLLLVHVLSFLDVKTRIRSELVCRRWRRVAKELPWSNPTKLVFSANEAKSTLSMPIHQINDEILRTILTRCGACVKEIVLKTVKCLDVPIVVTRNSIFAIAQYCPNLEILNLRFPVDTACLRAIADGCPNLKEVKIVNTCNEEFIEGYLTIVRESHYLECLKLIDQHVEEDWFSQINPKLKALRLENCELAEIGLLNLIERCNALEELELDNWKRDRVDDVVLFQVLDHFKATLKVIKFKDLLMRKDLNWGQGLAGLCHLEGLVLAFCESVNDDVLFMIANDCPLLCALDISDSKITDEGLAALTALSSLKSLDVSYTPITGEGLKIVACRGILEEVVLQCMVNITEANCCYLTRVLPNLRLVDMCGTKQITNRFVSAVCSGLKSGLLKGPIQLFAECTSITKDAPTCQGLELNFPVFVPRIISLENLESLLLRPEVPIELRSMFGKLAGGEVRFEHRQRPPLLGTPASRRAMVNRARSFFVGLRRRNFVPNRIRLFLNDLMG